MTPMTTGLKREVVTATLGILRDYKGTVYERSPQWLINQINWWWKLKIGESLDLFACMVALNSVY